MEPVFLKVHCGHHHCEVTVKEKRNPNHAGIAEFLHCCQVVPGVWVSGGFGSGVGVAPQTELSAVLYTAAAVVH